MVPYAFTSDEHIKLSTRHCDCFIYQDYGPVKWARCPTGGDPSQGKVHNPKWALPHEACLGELKKSKIRVTIR